MPKVEQQSFYTRSRKGDKDILEVVSRDDLLKVFTTTNVIRNLLDGEKHTLTPLGYSMSINGQEGIQAILDAAKVKYALKEVLTTANISVEFYQSK